MKKLSLVLLISLLSSNAFASKSRINALQFADFWVDTQTVFLYPQYVSSLGQLATFEFGPTATNSTQPHAEGGFFKKLNDGAYLGAYVGHAEAFANTMRAVAGAAEQKNPVFLVYSKDNMGLGLSVSYSNIKSTKEKDLTIGASFGTKIDNLDLGVRVIGYSQGETNGVKSKVAPEVELAANTTMGDLKVYGDVSGAAFNNGASQKTFGAKVGVQDHSMKVADKGNFFYGTEVRGGFGDIATTVSLPIYAGLEADVVSWAVVRGSLSQNLLVGLNKPKNTDSDFNANNTIASFGLGLKYNKFVLDALLAAGTNGNVNGSTFMTNAALTYFF